MIRGYLSQKLLMCAIDSIQLMLRISSVSISFGTLYVCFIARLRQQPEASVIGVQESPSHSQCPKLEESTEILNWASTMLGYVSNYNTPVCGDPFRSIIFCYRLNNEPIETDRL